MDIKMPVIIWDFFIQKYKMWKGITFNWGWQKTILWQAKEITIFNHNIQLLW